ncbi:urease accessory protein UreE [Rhodovulum steppense]|uniref:Urease accessory protein UreE n=1 Tax=Rhodovulum steppense TaxID=540251 RepID=A0A4R1YX17_9RHOB|nr:urease accessory protein UreE [Rhodovulum steppense]TCM85725.1 urease accessory protein [Rhodovulum steppense]
MSALPVARELRLNVDGRADDCVTLTYDARFLRRKRLVSDGGLAFLVDLARTTSLNEGDVLVLEDGLTVKIRAADEPLYEVTGPDLVRIAWHVGNRHTPCQIDPGRLVIQRDHVIRDMLERLGAEITEIEEPFLPEGGAYGHGRTHSHSHDHPHDHGHHHHGHDHDHHHDHPHDHGHHHGHDHGHGH